MTWLKVPPITSGRLVERYDDAWRGRVLPRALRVCMFQPLESDGQLRRFVPHVQKRVVASRRDAAAAFSSRTIQRRPDPFLAFRQLCQRYFQRDAFLNLIEIGENLQHNLFVLPMPSLRNIYLRHVFEVHRTFLGPKRHATSLTEAHVKLT